MHVYFWFLTFRTGQNLTNSSALCSILIKWRWKLFRLCRVLVMSYVKRRENFKFNARDKRRMRDRNSQKKVVDINKMGKYLLFHILMSRFTRYTFCRLAFVDLRYSVNHRLISQDTAFLFFASLWIMGLFNLLFILCIAIAQRV